MTLGRDTELTWLGHSTFRMRTPGGKTLIVDPWVMNNPVCPAEQKQVSQLDAMLITHGHFDHIADAVQLGKETQAASVAIFETASWLESKGVPNTCPMNKGGTVEVAGIKATMVHAVHSCGILDDGKIVYGGEASGYIIEMENGFRVYHAGDTMIFGDMKLIGELWRPDVALLPIGDRFTMDPRQAAMAARMLGVKHVIPMHHSTFPLLTGTPAQFREQLAGSGIEIVELNPGQSVA